MGPAQTRLARVPEPGPGDWARERGAVNKFSENITDKATPKSARPTYPGQPALGMFLYPGQAALGTFLD